MFFILFSPKLSGNQQNAAASVLDMSPLKVEEMIVKSLGLNKKNL